MRQRVHWLRASATFAKPTVARSCRASSTSAAAAAARRHIGDERDRALATCAPATCNAGGTSADAPAVDGAAASRSWLAASVSLAAAASLAAVASLDGGASSSMAAADLRCSSS